MPEYRLEELSALSGVSIRNIRAYRERGLLEPSEFLPLAEETGLIVPIGDWVIEQALGQVSRWRQSRPGMTISVNLSSRQLAQPDLVANLERALHAAGAVPGVLWLEVTEDMVQQACRELEKRLVTPRK